VDVLDMVLSCAVVALAAAAAAGWAGLYSWFVEPAKHHTGADTPFPHFHSEQDG